MEEGKEQVSADKDQWSSPREEEKAMLGILEKELSVKKSFKKITSLQETTDVSFQRNSPSPYSERANDRVQDWKRQELVFVWLLGETERKWHGPAEDRWDDQKKGDGRDSTSVRNDRTISLKSSNEVVFVETGPPPLHLLPPHPRHQGSPPNQQEQSIRNRTRKYNVLTNKIRPFRCFSYTDGSRLPLRQVWQEEQQF